MKTHSKTRQFIYLLLTLVVLVNCKKEKEPMIDTILLKEWTGPYGGVPAFDQMKVEDVKDAMLLGMELNLKEIDAIANNTDAPTFENTIEEMERAGAELERGSSYYGVLRSNMSTPEFRAIQTELAPLFSEFRSKIIQNKKLFQRVKAVYEASQEKPLDAAQQRVVDLTYIRFVMNGANLDEEKKERYAAINKELSGLYTKFSNNVLHDEENYITYLTKEQLGGLSDGFIKSAAKIAADKGQEGKYAITNTRSSMDPFLKYSTERALRKQVWTNYYARGDNGDAYDNNQNIADIL
ncbi:MAG: M3 family peptidase, partial [Maribacter sp.]|nr:M3 family peptidase [Maribacter sp.]